VTGLLGVERRYQAGRRLAGRGSITAQQAAVWIVLDSTPVLWRGQDHVETGPVVAFAEARAAIIRGTYPQAPPGRKPSTACRSRCVKGSGFSYRAAPAASLRSMQSSSRW
jgi:hypothetical protein